MQERDTESEADQKPPDSSGLCERSMNSLGSSMLKRNAAAVRSIRGDSGIARGRDAYANTNADSGMAKERLENSSQSCFLLFSRLL